MFKSACSVLLTLGLCAGCGEIVSPAVDAPTGAGKADTGGIDPASLEAKAIVVFANRASYDTLVYDAHLAHIAALNITAFKLGDDEAFGTADDQRFSSLASLDEVPTVGPAAFAKLRAYAEAHRDDLLSGACPGIDLLGTPEEVAVTPRADRTAEYLALDLDGGLVARTEIYERVHADLVAISALAPSLSIRYAGRFGNSLTFSFEPSLRAAIKTNTHEDLNCINSYYGVMPGALFASIDYFSASFGERRYSAPLLATVYRQVAGIAASPSRLLGDGNDVCVESDSTTRKYIVDEGSGDCAAGCTAHRYSGFSVSTDGSVTALGTYQTGDASTTDPEPAWFVAMSTCRARL